MALVERKAFADLIGVENKHITMYLKRGNIVKRDDGLFDTKDPTNILFINQRKGKESKAVLLKHVAKFPANPPPTELPENNGIPAIAPLVESGPEMEDFDWEAFKGKIPPIHKSKELIAFLDTKKREREIVKLDLDNKKKSGEVIPFDSVTPVFTMHNQSLITAFKNAAEDLITEFSNLRDFTQAETATMRGRMFEILEAASQKSIEASLKSLEYVISEYTNKRNKGEKQ